MAFTGDPLTAHDTSGDTQDAIGTTTSTAYTSTLTGGVACGLAFVAPASGKVVVHNSMYAFSNTANFIFMTIRVRTGGVIGAGVDVVPESDFRANVVQQLNAQTRSRLVSGLTPGNVYNVQQRFRVDGATTGQWSAKDLIVQPCT